MLFPAALARRQWVFRLVAVAQQTACADIALGIILLGGVGVDDPCRSGGMDETEHARRCIDLGDDTCVSYTALA